MIKIAIAEDEQTDKKALRDEIILYFKKAAIPFSIAEFNDGESLVSYVKGKGTFDIIFLDVYMTRSGIDTAKRLRSMETKSRIIFVTNSPHHALEAFSVYAIGYLLKPVATDKLTDILNLAINDMKKENAKNNKQLIIKSKGESFAIFYDRIISAESSLKKVYLYLDDGKEYECSFMTLTEVYEKLNDSRFLRCHNSFVVNMDKITKITNSYFTLVSGRTADITKRHFAGVKRKYFDYIAKKTDK